MVVMIKSALAVSGVAGALALGATPAAAGTSHTIVPFQSVGGIRLKWTPAQVRKHADKPNAVFHEHGKVSGYQYYAADIQVDFDIFDKRDRATEISAGSGPYHTLRGIHIGTSLKTLTRKLRGYDHFSCTKNIGCTIANRANSATPGGALTSFGVYKGKVIGIGVSYVFNDAL